MRVRRVFLFALLATTLAATLFGTSPAAATATRTRIRLAAGGDQTFIVWPRGASTSYDLRGSHFLVLPSVSTEEMFGLVLLEAMAAGRPVITTAVPSGVREVNEAGVTGLEVPIRDPEALAAAMRRLVDDPALRDQFGAAGRGRVAERFTVDRMVEAHLELYRKVRAPKG